MGLDDGLVNAKVRMPEHGQLVVKFWKNNGGVWAGLHIADVKHESFDFWFPLPTLKFNT